MSNGAAGSDHRVLGMGTEEEWNQMGAGGRINQIEQALVCLALACVIGLGGEEEEKDQGGWAKGKQAEAAR